MLILLLIERENNWMGKRNKWIDLFSFNVWVSQARPQRHTLVCNRVTDDVCVFFVCFVITVEKVDFGFVWIPWVKL